MRLSFESSRNLNTLNEVSTALPVVVRIYQLKNKERLEQADFRSLWKSDREVLGADFLDRREIILNPGENIQIDVDLMEESAFVAVMALFRKTEGKSWRQVVSLKGWGHRSFEVSLQKQAIRFVEK